MSVIKIDLFPVTGIQIQDVCRRVGPRSHTYLMILGYFNTINLYSSY
jgi:hypothetical protein